MERGAKTRGHSAVFVLFALRSTLFAPLTTHHCFFPVSFIELHSASAFSFLAAASLPEELAERAAELEMPALALVDRDGVYGAPRFYKAARKHGIRASSVPS